MRLTLHLLACHSRNLVVFAVFVLFGLVFNYCYFLSSPSFNSISIPSLPKISNPSSPSVSIPPSITEFSWFRSKSKFWHHFAPKLYAARPKCAPPKLLQKSTANRAGEGSLYNPVNLLEISDEDVLSMKKSHTLFLDMLDFDTPKLEFEQGTKGIVTTAGGAYFPVLLVSLLMLRRTGSQLPVEIFILDDHEYEPLLCEDVFPKLNARCLLISSYLSSSRRKFMVEGYQLKILSILFSNFEDVLFLDADDFPVSDPELLFDTPAYKSTGLVLWKDYWTPTFSPHFTNITKLDPEVLRSRQTIEAGQILISRSKKAKMLMLATYYNIFGGWYYELITQGGPGEGDKDTFVPAALVVDGENSFYTVEKGPDSLGTRGNGAAVLQFDLIGDWACGHRLFDTVVEKTHVSRPEFTAWEKGGGKKDERNVCEVSPLFIHASWPPKLNSLHNIRSERQWGSGEDALELFGEDVEKVVWGYMVEMACDSEIVEESDLSEKEGIESSKDDGGRKRKYGLRRAGGLNLGKLEFWDWGEGNKSNTRVCEQTRGCFRNMFKEEYVFGGNESKNESAND